MGNRGARAFGMEKAFIEVKESVDGSVKIVCHFPDPPSLYPHLHRSVPNPVAEKLPTFLDC